MDLTSHQVWKDLFSQHRVSSQIAEIASKEDGQVFQVVNHGEVRVSTQKASVMGDNYMSDAYSVEIQLENGTKHSAFIKVLPSNPVLRETAYLSKIYHREIGSYRDLLPTLRAFQKENGVSTEDYDITAPEAYYVHLEDIVKGGPDGSGTVVVLEDLKCSGFQMTDKKLGCDYEHARLTLRALANYHATSLAFIRQNKLDDDVEKFPPKLRFLTEEVFFAKDKTCEMIRGISPLHIGILRASNLNEEADWFENQVANLENVMIFTEKLSECDSLPTFVHGDTWINNMMYRYEDGRVVAARLVDWQLIRTGHPGTDIVYFFFNSTTGEVRKQHLDQLLRDYYNHFNKVLSLYDIHLENEGYSFDKFRGEVEKRYVWGMFMACMILPMILDTKTVDKLKEYENEESRDLVDANVDELMAETEEKFRELYTSDILHQNKLLCQRITDMVREVKKVVENSSNSS